MTKGNYFRLMMNRCGMMEKKWILRAQLIPSYFITKIIEYMHSCVTS